MFTETHYRELFRIQADAYLDKGDTLHTDLA